jgi:hypothetical protein
MIKVVPYLANDEPFQPQAAIVHQGIGAAIMEVTGRREDLSSLACTPGLDENIRQIVAHNQVNSGIKRPLQCAF